jgi:hypothetical protein
MKTLQSKSFMNSDKLTAFVNKEGILREDILIITSTEYGCFLFYYVEE